jgi:hypothetical protein
MFSSHFIINISVFSHLIPLSVGIYFYNKMDTSLKIISFLVFFHLCLEFISELFIIVFKSNFYVFSVLNFVDLVVLSYVLLSDLKSKPKVKLIIAFALVFFCIMFFEQTLINKKILVLNVISGVYAGLVELILSLLLFYNLVKNITAQGITSKPSFWIASGLLFNCCFSILFNIYFQSFYTKEQDFMLVSALIRAIGIIIANILFTFAFLTKAKSHHK